MPRTRAGRAIGDIARAVARGELTAAQAAALTARIRAGQRQALYRAALDTLAAPGEPVQVRLIGRTGDVANLLTVLDETTALTGVSDPYPTSRPGVVRVYATAERRHPLIGGSK
ncbi:hypothetical protein [Catellatospora citrea]|uniref:Uncharacterized protein n=1 Tax=Catellatospora citrea TaxID=53366 RepID=A0A8J3KNL9_9ACTN|nr:hypothetical protein [Catellatospora citrea]RKE08367.1 hypothetical protein C8E86_3217 [Catellatospora citrea]GIG03157.1 hypothetical protein Cci01nite_82500 [Catellatospora citrea]